MSSPSVARRSGRPPRAHSPRSLRWRWIAVLVVVAIAHWIAAQWFERHRDTFKPADQQHVPVQVALLKPERIEQQPAGAPTPPATPAARQKLPEQAPQPHALTAIRPERKPKKQPAPRAPVTQSTMAEKAQPKPDEATSETASPVADAAASTAASTAASAAAGTAASAAAASGPQAGSPAQAASAANGTDSGSGNAAHATPGVKFSVPPSGDLEYDTFYNGVRNQPGTIHWESDGHTYRLVISVPLPFVGTYSYESHGRVDAFGLAPDQYIETHGRRGQDVTVFNRETRQIAFTRTPKTLALQDGAQDRFSMIMQLASLVRGAPDAYQPGVTREFYVTDNDSGEIWPIETIGDETVRTQQGFVEARHFTRLPRRAGDRRRIDVWLAPSLGWLPVRFVQTEPNGTQVELLWHGETAAPNEGATNANDQNPGPQPATPSAADPNTNYERP
ncbi:DUF3108 domain-containing protein [Paraburkholderia sp. SARCC-3016]|uniref:DUF3108 domain-containing protein n=1 Tax=Paraburkholderia sp. SARCC-3016 TaxID=3058611 RepID=UPI002806A14B|nr:DUF3108 domain-containing protein [Paraburkholderia sp. SARCC-3016]MDQ7980222.1 DUF3108 domain-containing protein [Paraburkholderia sp. SARCC-3016]